MAHHSGPLHVDVVPLCTYHFHFGSRSVDDTITILHSTSVDPVSSDSSSDAKSMVVFGVVICFCRLYHAGSSGEQLASRS